MSSPPASKKSRTEQQQQEEDKEDDNNKQAAAAAGAAPAAEEEHGQQEEQDEDFKEEHSGTATTAAALEQDTEEIHKKEEPSDDTPETEKIQAAGRARASYTIPKLTPRGMKTSLTYRGFLSCDSTADDLQGWQGAAIGSKSEFERNFPLPDIRALDTHLDLGLGETVSCLRALIDSRSGSLKYYNHHDVMSIVNSALLDAIQICRAILEAKAESWGCEALVPITKRLGMHHASSMFTNIVDHVLVMDGVLCNEGPILYVECDTVWHKSAPIPETVMQKFHDQLLEMHMKGHPNPFGVMTCFDETFIFWLDNDASQAVIESLVNEGYQNVRLNRIFRGLLVKALEAGGGKKPPAGAATQETLSSGCVLNEEGKKKKEEEEEEDRFVPFDKQNRNVLHSAPFEVEMIVSALVCAIICSLDGFQGALPPLFMNSVSLGQQIHLPTTLCLEKKSHVWGALHTKYRGPLKKRPKETASFFLVEYLGEYGSTSKLYRALTLNGYECVVNIYVKERDDDKHILSKKEFQKEAKKAVQRELKIFKTMYGDELREYVWTQELNGMHCIIHPYFKPLDKTTRLDQLPLISERMKLFLNTKNAKNGTFCTYYCSHSWKYVGWFNDKLYLYGLGDLEEYDLKEADDVLEYHCNHLRDIHNYEQKAS